MELNQIRYFIALADTLHFTRAAEVCNVSQPALTRAIQKLEEELGGSLFHRERGHTQLTDLGRVVLPSLTRAFVAVGEAKAQATAFQRRETSPLRIGLEFSIPASVLTPVMASLQQRDQEIELTLRQGGQAELCESMLESEIDVALLVDGADLPERMHRWNMFSERYILICPPDHRFKDTEIVSVEDMSQECLLLHENMACPARRFALDLCERHHVKPRRQHFGSSLEQIFGMVHASLGISVAGERLPTVAPLIRRPIDADANSRSVVVATVAGRPLGPTPALFLKMMRARAWSQDANPAANVGAA
jgi:DNA-binding transcriptional LysR family regulator